MASSSLTFNRHLEHVQAEASRFDAAIERAPIDVRVPSCPDWDQRALRDHQAGVLAFWTRQLADDAGPAGPRRDGVEDETTRPVAELAADLVVRLAEIGPERPCWNWSGVNQTSGWVARRMAQEISVHRVDAESIGGAASPIDDDIAADGIDELIDVFVDAPPGAQGGPTLVLLDELADRRWPLQVTAEGLIRVDERSPDASLTGGASAILLALWQRPNDAAWSGPAAVREALEALTGFE